MEVGERQSQWLHHNLVALQHGLIEQGSELILRSGETASALAAIVAETGATAVYCSRHYQPWSEALERSVKEAAGNAGAELKRYPGTLLFEPEDVATGGGTPFKVFTPFWRACNKRPHPAAPCPPPTLSAIEQSVASEELEDWRLTPTAPNWAFGWNDLWSPGETGAHQALSRFLSDHVQDYGDGRDLPAEPNTSKLSPYLRFGNISPRQVWHAAQRVKNERPEETGSIDKFLSELGWREFCYHLLFHFPHMPDEAFNPKFSFFPWGKDEERHNAGISQTHQHVAEPHCWRREERSRGVPNTECNRH